MRWKNGSSRASKRTLNLSKWLRLPLATALLPVVFACSSSDTTDTSDTTTPDAGSVARADATVDTPDAGSTEAPDGGAVHPDAEPLSEECSKPANVAKRDALLAAQPTLDMRSRTILTVTSTFASVADDPAQTCSVPLQFKDSDGDGTLTPYEDWRRSPAARAADLVARLSDAEKAGLMAHPTTSDAPSGTTPTVSDATKALIQTSHVRFGLTAANRASVSARAKWANAVQELAEAEPFGVPFVLSSEPAHTSGNGRTKASGFSQWPYELSLAAANDAAVVEGFGRVVSEEYRAIGVRMALSVPADLYTDPRWYGGQFTFGEDSASVANLVEAYVRGLQGATLGSTGVAAVVGHFPGAGAARDGWDARLAKGKYLHFSGTSVDDHLAPFARAVDAGAAAVMPAYGVPEAGAWTGLGGRLSGATLEQVGATYNRQLLTDVLRTGYSFGGLVLAPWGVLEDTGVSPLGAPWGMESATKAARIAKAVTAGVDQFGGLADPAEILAAKTAGLITQAQLDTAASHALALIFRLGLFESPYVDASKAPSIANSDPNYRAGLRALAHGVTLLVNSNKPSGWLNGNGNGTQTGDKGNAGNGSGKVLPAPPGEPYVSAGCSYYILGNFDLDYVRGVSTGYGELTNDATAIKNVTVSTAEERMALSDYVFIRLGAPVTADPDSGRLGLPTGSLSWTGADNAADLAYVAQARAVIDAWRGSPASQAQIIVGIDAGRLPLLDELLAYGVAGVYVDWSGTMSGGNLLADKIFLDVAFGLAESGGRLPVGLPASAAAVEAQAPDLAGDGQSTTYVRGFGLPTAIFQ